MNDNPLSLEQQAGMLMAEGVTLASTSDASLDGSYALGYLPMLGLQAEVNALLLSQGTTFADGTTSLNWPDKAGAHHAFTPAQFHDFALAVSNFAVQCVLFAQGGAAPSTTITIA